MDQITITREEFREKIVKNPEKMKSHEMQIFLEELTLMMALREIETDLFGPEE